MERGTTLILKLTLLVIALPVLALCVYGLPVIAMDPGDNYPASWVYLLVALGYTTAIPYFTALFQSFKLLSYIDKNIAFSDLSVKALKTIKYCAFTFSLLYVIALPLFYYIAENDDAPGVIVIGLVFAFTAFVVAVFAAVLQRLLKNAIDIKSENDLTV
ncbi:hypothetical protein DFQ01_11635 [Paenibacillus cellulosilyticus]|uniref:DUF2975 family protein n=1 Tax=Paenibacillus cellulosilyticus TaxID=375489 RepID=A0A2V2YQD3_9BACL|nr:DUF2975 domain-containing protein [Paenibacillus cellulosilyticus]PWV98636.1 hypothetical protein DFQ01_11635 [Paenibacillus cellulosilyticus]QKS43848.1 DUF2975 domain-containing protein [Paenibacillus cellulosilyticus]